MVVQNLQDMPWTTDQELMAGQVPEGWLEEGARTPADEGDKNALLGSEVARVRGLIQPLQGLISRLETWSGRYGNDSRIGGFESLSDEAMLGYIRQACGFSDRAFTRLEPVRRCVERFEAIRDGAGVWNNDAAALLKDLQHLESVLCWAEDAGRRWSEQLCEEYLRRHPELPKSPVEPIDFGPTDSARLPSIV